MMINRKDREPCWRFFLFLGVCFCFFVLSLTYECTYVFDVVLRGTPTHRLFYVVVLGTTYFITFQCLNYLI